MLSNNITKNNMSEYIQNVTLLKIVLILVKFWFLTTFKVFGGQFLKRRPRNKAFQMKKSQYKLFTVLFNLIISYICYNSFIMSFNNNFYSHSL